MLAGVFYFPTDYGIDIGELARAVEERGLESLFVCEHTHIPVSRKSPFPGGGELPKRYVHTHDPFVALSFAAAATKKIKLGTGICLIPQRDPIITAKQVASLDQLSGGRFVFAMGGGWNVDEMENHGAKYETRFKLLRERVLAMKELWTKEKAEYHGEFVNFDPVWLYPKPKQQAASPAVPRRRERPHLEARGGVLRRLVPAGTRRLRSQGFGGAAAQGGDSRGPRSQDLVDRRVRRTAGQGEAEALSRRRHPARALRRAGRQPRRDPAHARSGGSPRQGLSLRHRPRSFRVRTGARRRFTTSVIFGGI